MYLEEKGQRRGPHAGTVDAADGDQVGGDWLFLAHARPTEVLPSYDLALRTVLRGPAAVTPREQRHWPPVELVSRGTAA